MMTHIFKRIESTARAGRRTALALITLLGANAFGTPTVDVETSRFVASDPIDMASTRVNVHEGRFVLGTEMNQGLSPTVSYQGLKGFAGGHAGWRGVDASATLGANRLTDAFADDVSEGEEQTIPVYKMHLQYAGLGLEHAHDFVYQEWTQPAAATAFLAADTYTASTDLGLAKPVRLKAHATYAHLSDGNDQVTGDAAVLTRVYDRRHRVLIGPGLWFDDFAHRASYWTPHNFASTTLRTETHLHWSDALGLDLKVDAGYAGANFTTKLTTVGFDAKIEYRPHPDWHLALGGVHQESYDRRGTSTWQRNDIYGSLAASL